MEEKLEIYDHDLKKIGICSRHEAHQKGLWHAVSHLWITDLEKGCLYLQKRSLDKDQFGGYYDISSAGHIDPGERPAEAMVREVREELGLRLSERDLIFLGTIIEHFGNDHEIAYIFTSDISQPTFQPGPEVSDILSVSISDWLQEQSSYHSRNLDNQEVIIQSQQICPHDQSYLRAYLEKTFSQYEKIQ